MRKLLVVVCTAAMMLSVTAAVATAAPTNAKNYEAIPATCDELGEIVIEVVSLGQWSTGKVQGTQLTLIPRFFEFTATHQETGTTVFEETISRQNTDIDDTCTFTFVEEVPEGDPELEPGTYVFEGTVGVKVVGR